MIVSVVLLGVAGAAVLATVAGSGNGASVQRAQADTQLALSSAADALTGVTPQACAGAQASYQATARARFDALKLGRGWTSNNIAVTRVQSYDVASSTFATGCTNASALQKVTLRVTSPDGKSSKTLEVLTASATATTPIGNPLRFASSEFSVITKGAATMSGTQVYGALAVGGDLTYTATGPIAANSAGTYPAVLGANSNIGLLVDGTVNFAGSSGDLQVNNNASIVLGDMSNGKFIAPGGTSCFVADTSQTQCAGKKIVSQSNGRVVAGHPFDFAAAYDFYRKTSVALAALPGTCTTATSLILRDQNGNGVWPGSGNFKVQMTPGVVNVLNLPLAQAAAMASASGSFISTTPSASTPLIINVVDSGSVTINPTIFTQGFEPSVIWNFPNATTLRLNGKVHGSLYAPSATVYVTQDVRGVVIADSVIATGGVADWSNRPAINDIQCTRTG